MKGMFFVRFSELFELSLPESRCPFSDFMANCTHATREIYCAFSRWWVDEYFRLEKLGLLEIEQ